MSKEKKSILEEAADDLQKIVEAAKKVAKDTLAKELPDKFDMLLKEEVEKLVSKESVKESGKDKTKEPVTEGKKTGKDKESLNEDMDMRNFSMEEVENSYDQANSMDEFDVNPESEGQKGNQPEVTVDDIASALESMDGLQQQQEAENANDPYNKFKELYEAMGKIVKEMDDKKMHEKYGAEFDSQMNNSFGEGYKDSLGEEKCNELYEMFVARKNGDPFKEGGAVNEKWDKDVKVKHTGENTKQSKAELEKELSGLKKKSEKEHEKGEKTDAETKKKEHQKEFAIRAKSHWGKSNESVEDKGEPFEEKSDPSAEQGESIDEMHEKVPHGATAPAETGHNTTPAGIKEEEGSDKEPDNDRDDNEKVDEIHGQSYSAGKVRAGTLPNQGAEYRDRPGHSRDREQWSHQNESYKKRMDGLINENKKLTKQLNEVTKISVEAESLVENYKTHLEKYRNQLREMAVFNTNLANVNNLLVNEELALTTEDKVSIIDRFKKINSIDESDKAYDNLLTEMKTGKKTLSETVESKVSNSVGESSKQKIDEAIERTAYENNEHVKKLKYLMDYVDKRK